MVLESRPKPLEDFPAAALRTPFTSRICETLIPTTHSSLESEVAASGTHNRKPFPHARARPSSQRPCLPSVRRGFRGVRPSVRQFPSLFLSPSPKFSNSLCVILPVADAAAAAADCIIRPSLHPAETNDFCPAPPRRGARPPSFTPTTDTAPAAAAAAAAAPPAGDGRLTR